MVHFQNLLIKNPTSLTRNFISEKVFNEKQQSLLDRGSKNPQSWKYCLCFLFFCNKKNSHQSGLKKAHSVKQVNYFNKGDLNKTLRGYTMLICVGTMEFAGFLDNKFNGF